MTKQKIFFSYSRVDGSAFALKLAVDLKKKGFDVWIDQEDIRAGLDWDTEIEKALESCDYVLFVETEKSVVSNNVLDEVYYALDQHKKVIPLIYVDSKTPFRLNRLQHVDFTKDYNSGLALLVNELEGNTQVLSYPPEEKALPAARNKTFYTKNALALLVIACLAVLITVVIVLSKNKSAASGETKGAIALTDTTINESGRSTHVPDTQVINATEAENRKSGAEIVPVARKRNDPGKDVPVGSVNVNTGSAKPVRAKTENNLSNLSEIVAGDWSLRDVEPKAKSQRGYLKIEALDENKAAIKVYVQFYYSDSKTPPYLTIFNAFVGCASCAVNKEMKLKVEDIAVATTNYNKTINGTATLQFVDDNNAVIRVKQPLSIELANGLMLEPFTYAFHFKKED